MKECHWNKDKVFGIWGGLKWWERGFGGRLRRDGGGGFLWELEGIWRNSPFSGFDLLLRFLGKRGGEGERDWVDYWCFEAVLSVEHALTW